MGRRVGNSTRELVERTADYNPLNKLTPPKNWQEFIDRMTDEE
jgi:hypothetical protein